MPLIGLLDRRRIWPHPEGSIMFKETGRGNQYATFNGFTVSYNPNTASLPFGWSGDGEETALIVDGKYFILNGDFRQEYVALADDGVEAALAFFRGKPELVSSWSDEE